MTPLKLAVMIPVYDKMEAMFVASLNAAIRHFSQARLTDGNGDRFEVDVQTFVVQSSNLCQNRHRLVAEALHCRADYMLFCDADHVFPEDAIARLWSRGVDIVGCNYARRCIPTAPTAVIHVTDDEYQDHKNLVYTTPEKAHDNVLEEVSHLGFGLVLMRMGVLDALTEHADREGLKSFLPLFRFDDDGTGENAIGEDVFFFNKCRAAGLKVWCDHGVSWDVGHVSSTLMMNAHAVKQKERWEEGWKAQRARFEQRAAQIEADLAETNARLEGAA